MKISIVIPVLNEAQLIAETLEALQVLRLRGHEIVIVDGGSMDGTVGVARPGVDQVVLSSPGRARQMNAGAAASIGEVIWFLHADTRIPDNADKLLISALASSPPACWGYFNVRLTGQGWTLTTIAALMNLRSRISGVATGDQGIFVYRDIFNRMGGFADIPLMEDVEISKRLRRLCWPVRPENRLFTSSRRWEENGIFRTVVLMWCLRMAFFVGVPAGRLARLYD